MRRDPPLILNVNDDEANRYVLTRILRRAAFEVTEAGSGEQALARMSERPDLVVLDVRLPDTSGFEVCRRIKGDPSLGRPPVLMVSAHFTRTENRVEGLEGGADGYLVQPVDELELLATVRALLRLKRAEEEARAAAVEWSSTFDAIGDAVCLVGREGRISRANRALGQLMQRPAEALVGAEAEAVFRSAFPGLGAASLARLAALEAHEAYELQVGARWLRVSSDPVCADGVLLGGVRVLTDVTERKHLEDELRRRADELATMDRRKDEFLGMLAHELRNPLAAITPALHLIDRHASEADRTAAHRELAIRKTRHLAQLVDDLLDVSRITRGKVQLRPEPVGLSEIVARAVQSSEAALREKGHALELSLGTEELVVSGDPTRLEQIVCHLIDNAVCYTAGPGRIAVGLGAVQRGERAWARLEVQDSGVGIPREHLESIFDLFSQVDPGIDRGRGGLGVGLSLTQKLVQLHGGTVRAHSEGVGKGSSFAVELPLLEGRQKERPAREPGEAAAAGSSGKAARPQRRRVLLVEDNEDARDALRDLLEVWGHQVEIAVDGEEGEAKARRLRPEIALIDVGLPKVDGYELARRLRASAEVKNAYLVALTGYGGPEQKSRALQAGFDLHVVKPVAPERLDQLIRLAPVRTVG